MKRTVFLVVSMLAGSMVAVGVNAKQHNVPTERTPVIECQDLADAFRYPNTTITTTELAAERSVEVAGIGPMPEHCIVTGKMNERVSPVDGQNYAIGFQMRLPTKWQGRFFYQANGGVDGRIVDAFGDILGGGPTSNGLLKGFAVISSDAGHSMVRGSLIGGGLFGIDPQARLDYGYNAVAELTPMAKNLIKTYYGRVPARSYMVGTSNGGRHTMVAASWLAEEYDGFLASAPGFNLPKAAVAQLWGVQQYATIADNGSNGRPDISSSFSPEDTAMVSDAILAKCDALDGVGDDMVGDPVSCQEQFSIQTDIPTCEGESREGCLTYGQKAVLARVHNGAQDSSGKHLYSNFFWDPGIRSAGWRTWKFANSTNSRDPLAVGFVFMTPPKDPVVLDGTGTTLLDFALNWNGTGFDVDRDAPKIYATNEIYAESAMSFMTPPDLLMKKLHATKGKMIVVHGTGDPVFSAADTVKWYEALTAHYKKHTTDFARLFLVPGMNHSRGGPACDQYDLVDALVQWVEKGVRPTAVIAKARGDGNPEVPATWAPDRSRPLCVYPAVPVYKGDGDVEDASSFSCKIQ
ncbi:tannase/feruloyl esterase family alpha/beta hydrolase [Desulfopila aestuarii]|uniref:Feruloyl esterase n=1 Tax=Desulfopila aestuarii DSM 18488 TaxID=1121416 RepID=A0A1M7YKF4_9BACT|nr:tannase/feruloyl esterase family alpha/beta hydrolase [Desulfopila aestuarii]SHO53094.1 feruloyl esterase [Desulfopila aestuarii DSM 18488]